MLTFYEILEGVSQEYFSLFTFFAVCLHVYIPWCSPQSVPVATVLLADLEEQ